MSTQVLEKFSELEPFAAKWSLATEDERRAVRKAATREEIREFYDVMLRHLESVLDLADKYPKGDLPPELERYFFMALSLAEVAPHVELYKGNPNVPFSFTEERFIGVHGQDRG